MYANFCDPAITPYNCDGENVGIWECVKCSADLQNIENDFD